MTRSRGWIGLLGFGVVLVSLGVGWAARAAIGNSRTWGTIPYRGHIELDGAVQDTLVDMVLSLWDAPSEKTKLWEETQLAVPVRSSDFAVRLGAVTVLNQAVEGAQDLHLAIEVREAGSSTFEPLSGRQAIGSVPFALAAKRGVPGQEFTADQLSVSNPSSERVLGTGLQNATSSGSVLWYDGDLRVKTGQTGATGDRFTLRSNGSALLRGDLDVGGAVRARNAASECVVSVGLDFNGGNPTLLDFAKDGDETTATSEGITRDVNDRGAVRLDCTTVRRGVAFVKMGIRVLGTGTAGRWEIRTSSDNQFFHEVWSTGTVAHGATESVIHVAVPIYARSIEVGAIDTANGQLGVRVYELTLRQYE